MPAGYSGTPLAKKLGIKEGHRLALIGAPEDFAAWVAPLPSAVRIRTDLRGNADTVVAFFDRRAELVRRLPTLAKTIHPDGGLWISWPKKSSGVPTDITEDTLREVGLPLGIVDVKVCAVSEVWSGLRFVWRKENR